MENLKQGVTKYDLCFKMIIFSTLQRMGWRGGAGVENGKRDTNQEASVVAQVRDDGGLG